MKIVAIELSSAVGDVALLESDRIVARREIPFLHGRVYGLFGVLEEVREESAWTWGDVDVFAAGRGPGRYSGMRVALTAARGLALPGGTSVFAVSSGAALAAATMAERSDVDQVAVVGDARRGQAWFGVYERATQGVEPVGDWRMAAYADLSSALPPGAVRVTSEWSRLAAHVVNESSRGDWVEQDRYPSAEWVGRLAHVARRAGWASEPLAPIYLHPAVNVS